MDGGSRRSSAEMQDVGQLVLVEFLHHRPEPLDDLVSRCVGLLVDGVSPPVIEVNEGDAVEDHLQLVGLENLEQALGDNPV